MASKTITYGQLHRLLLDLHFENVPAQCPGRAYRHAASDTVILVADRRQGHPARRPDLLSIRRHLAENGILAEAEFDRILAAAS